MSCTEKRLYRRFYLRIKKINKLNVVIFKIGSLQFQPFEMIYLDEETIGEPYMTFSKEQKEINDTDKIRMDWYNVGNDIKNAYEKYKQAATR